MQRLVLSLLLALLLNGCTVMDMIADVGVANQQFFGPTAFTNCATIGRNTNCYTTVR